MNTYNKIELLKFIKMSLLLAFIGINTGQVAKANDLREARYQTSALKIKSKDTKFVSLGTGHFIDRISFEAKRALSADENCNLSLTLDGQQVQNVSISKTGWRTYVVTFADFSRTLEVKNRSDRGFIKIKNIKILPKRVTTVTRGPVYDHLPTSSDIYYQLEYLRGTVDYLYHVVNQDDRSMYLDNFTIVLGDATAVLETSSELSMDARSAVQEVVNSLKYMTSFINMLIQTPNLSEIGREMKSAQRSLERALQN